MKKLIAICILSLVAFFNAAYLTMQDYKIQNATDKTSISSFCDLNNTLSCTNVLASPYSRVFWLPFPAIALVVYPIIFLIAYLGLNRIIKKPFHILAAMWAWWMMFNWYFISMEFLYIWSYCPLCLWCSVIITTIFILWVIWIFNPIKEDKPKTFIDKAKSIFKKKK